MYLIVVKTNNKIIIIGVLVMVNVSAFICILVLSCAFPILTKNQTLLLAIEYARHGVRYPSTEMFDWMKGKRYLLTPSGMRQHYILGRMLRKRYIEDTKFLPEFYNPEEILVHTSYASRTIVSAQSQLAGLYTPGTGARITKIQQKLAVPPNIADYSRWVNDLGNVAVEYAYQPIPLEGMKDSLMVPSEVCPGIAAMVKKFGAEHQQDKADKEKDFKDIYKELAEVFNIEESKINMPKALQLRDVLVSSLWEGHYIKNEPTNRRLVEKTEEIDKYYSYTYYFNAQYGKRVVHKILASPFLNKVKELLSQKVDSEEKGSRFPLKFALFVGHDTMFNANLMGLGINKGDILAPFTSAVLIELYKDLEDLSYSVKVKFGDKPMKNFTLDKFYDLITKNVYDSATFEEYCKEFKVEEEDGKNHIYEYVVAAICALAAVTALIIGILYFVKYLRKDKEKLDASVNRIINED